MSDDLVKRLRDPAFGTETTERNLMNTAANRIEELEAERDDYAFKWAEANNTYSEMHVALSELNDKLAKAVEALEKIAQHDIQYWAINTLAELKGEK